MLKKIWSFLTADLNITITPPPNKEVKTFRIKRIIPFILVIIICSSFFTLGFLYKYYKGNYILSNNKLARLTKVEEKNQNLKDKLYSIMEETNQLKESLENLEKQNNKIKGIIDFKKKSNSKKKDENNTVKLKLTTDFSLDWQRLQGMPMGGGSLDFYRDPNKLIKRVKNNLTVIKEELPTQKNILKGLETSAKKYKIRKNQTPLIWPVSDNGEGYISSEFGWRVDPMTGKREFHEGLDIAVWYNNPVIATADGKVTYAGWASGYGRFIKISHGYGYTTCYGHLNKIKVRVGQKVERGDVIGLSGNSGKSTGPHLHYEVRLNNVPQNPRNYIGR